MEIVAGLPLKYLRLESPSSPMNMSQLVYFRAPSNNGKQLLRFSLDTVKHAVYQQLSKNKALRQRLIESPFQLASPVWIDDPHMDINYHVQQSCLKTPFKGEKDQYLLDIAASLSAHSFDRGSPLWRLHLITSDASDDFAFVCITHRALLCRLHETLFDALFPKNIQFEEEARIESITVECPRTGSKFGFSWMPESIPSRNDLLALAKSDWLMIPKQTKAFGSMVLGRWAKRKLAKAIVDKNDLPPMWISAPQSIFNQPTGKKRAHAFVHLPASTSRQLLRNFKGFEVRDLVLALLSRTLKNFLESFDHHTKNELIALVQCNSLTPEACQWEREDDLDDYQLIRLPTNINEPMAQLQSILERRTTAREYSQFFDKQADLGMMPSSILSLFIHTYNKFGIHHFHKPICNLVISEQPPAEGATDINGYTRTSDASFASLLPNIGLHVSYWLKKESACISFTTGSTAFKAQELADAFEQSIEYLNSSLSNRLNEG